MTEPTLDEVIGEIRSKYAYAIDLWGTDFDDTHTPADWWAFANLYFARGVPTWKFDKGDVHAVDITLFRSNMVKLATIALGAIQWCDRRRSK